MGSSQDVINYEEQINLVSLFIPLSLYTLPGGERMLMLRAAAHERLPARQVDTIKGWFKMKSLRLALALVMVFVAALMLTAPARADDQSGKRTPFFIISASMVEIPPTEVIVHTENTIIRGGWYLWNITTSDPRVGGYWNIHGDNLILKTNHPTPYWGPGHGTWTMDSNKDGNVEWQGVVHIMPFTDDFITHYTGNGVGIYEGLQIKMGDHDGVFTGEIFDPKAQ